MRLDAADPAHGTLRGRYWLTVSAAEAGPLVVSVDDLHWSDPASLRYLAHLVRRLDGLGVLVLATMRARRSPEPGVIDEVTDGADAADLRLPPLSAEEVSALLTARLGTDPDPQFSSTVTEWTAGNPLLLRELMAAAVVRRIEPTPAGARQIRELTPQGVGRLCAGSRRSARTHSRSPRRRDPQRGRRDRPGGRACRPDTGGCAALRARPPGSRRALA